MVEMGTVSVSRAGSAFGKVAGQSFQAHGNGPGGEECMGNSVSKTHFLRINENGSVAESKFDACVVFKNFRWIEI